MSGPDDDLKAELPVELASTQRSLGVTTIYVTHSRSEAAALAHRVAFMKDGCVIQVGAA